MEERYALLARAGVRHIGSYNQLGKKSSSTGCNRRTTKSGADSDYLPYIVIVADEMADLMMTAAKEVEAAHYPPGAKERGRSASTWCWPRKSRPST